MLKTKQIVTISVTAIIFFVLGMAIPPGNTVSNLTGGGSFQDGWKAAEQRLAETGFAPMMGTEGMGIKSVSGEIKEIGNSKITLKIQPLSPLADKELDTRIIEVADAKIYQLIERDQTQFQKEMEAFSKKAKAQIDNPEMMAEPIFPPEMFIKQEISLDDLQVGQQIMVTAQEDIKEAKQFKATEITLQFTPMAPEMLGAPLLK